MTYNVFGGMLSLSQSIILGPYITYRSLIYDSVLFQLVLGLRGCLSTMCLPVAYTVRFSILSSSVYRTCSERLNLFSWCYRAWYSIT